VKAKTKKAADFIRAGELAGHLGVTTDTLSDWIARGTMPPPWLWASERVRLWRRADYEAFKRDREWPKAAWKEAT
jgi:predicted DNA-binding transcriptional regulator AlpA